MSSGKSEKLEDRARGERDEEEWKIQEGRRE